MHRTLVFADSAPHAELWIEKGPFQEPFPSFPGLDFDCLEPYSLGGGWTDLFTYNTVDIHGPRETTAPVIKGSPDFNGILIRFFPDFLFDSQRNNRSGGADLTAEDAIEFAIADLVEKDWRP